MLAGEAFDLATSPESQEHQSLLAAEERVDSAKQRVRTLEVQRKKLQRAVEYARRAADQGDGVTHDDLAAAELRLDNVTRRLAKAEANLESAEAELSALTEV
jgi:outer membrane protein TolC